MRLSPKNANNLHNLPEEMVQLQWARPQGEDFGCRAVGGGPVEFCDLPPTALGCVCGHRFIFTANQKKRLSTTVVISAAMWPRPCLHRRLCARNWPTELFPLPRAGRM